MNNYFRITAYNPDNDVSAIFDSYSYYEKLWQFSAFLIEKGFKIVEVGNIGSFSDENITVATPNDSHLILRACAMGKPEYKNGVITINGKMYKPNKNE